MGLCEHRRVTNLFCYEHNTNVCDVCVVSEKHSKCIVKSYLLWLQDADYEPTCKLCNELLKRDESSSDDCARLLCLDIFHRSCLMQHCRSLPSNLTPKGYKCPICGDGIFPANHQSGAIAEKLRGHLLSESWARRALGLNNIDSGDEEELMQPFEAANVDKSLSQATTDVILGDAGADTDNDSQHTIDIDSIVGRHPKLSHSSSPPPISSSSNEHSNNKYAAKPLSLILSNWLRLIAPRSSARQTNRLAVIIVLIFIAIFTLFLLMSRVSRHVQSSDRNPMLDPLANPMLKVGE